MMNARRIFPFALAALLLVGAGCGTAKVAVDDQTSGDAANDAAPQPKTHDEADGIWRSVDNGVDRAVFPVGSEKLATMELYRFSGDDLAAHMESDETAKMTVAEWADKIGGPSLVVNGTYFHADNLPSGFLTTDGKRAGKRQFDQDKSGLLQFSPTFKIIDTRVSRVDLTPEKFPDAAQSYPFLIAAGKADVRADSGQQSRRTFVGQDVDGKLYVGVVDDGFVSLYGLTDALQNTEVQWQDVLNLDGGSSTGLVSTFGTNESRDSFAQVPNVLVVKRLTEEEKKAREAAAQEQSAAGDTKGAEPVMQKPLEDGLED